MAFSDLRHQVRNKFLAGLLVVLPAFITLLLVRFTFGLFEGVFSSPFASLFKLIGYPQLISYHLPGILGLFILIVITLLVGVIVTNVIGKKTFRLIEKMFSKVPLVWNIYYASKQLMESISITGRKAFRQVVLVEYPRQGIYAIGFLTSDSKGEIQAVTKKETVNVFVPTTPNPTSGLLVIVPADELITLSMSIEEGIKMVVSGGMVVPPMPKEVTASGNAVNMQADEGELTTEGNEGNTIQSGLNRQTDFY